MSDLKIIGLVVRNFKGIKYAEMKFDPDAKVIRFCGPNNSGKTTIGQVLEFSLFGKKAISNDAVTHGAANLETELDLGKFKIKRRHPSTKLEIQYPDGLTREKGKQDFLTSLQHEWAFNPSPILEMKPDELERHLKKIGNINLSEFDKEIEQLKSERYDIGVEERAIGVEEIPKVESVDVSALLEEKNRIQAQIEAELEEIRVYNQAQSDLDDRIANEKRELTVNNFEVQELREKLEAAIKKRDATKNRLTELPTPKPLKIEAASQTTKEIDRQILEADGINRKYEAWKRNEENRQRKLKKKEQYKSLTRNIEAVEALKTQKMESADFGVKGLKVTEKGVYLDGIFCKDLSFSSRLKMAWELNVNAGDFPIKAFYIDNGESLDPDKFEAMETLAKEKGLQFFVTIRTDPGQALPEESENVFYLEELKK